LATNSLVEKNQIRSNTVNEISNIVKRLMQNRMTIYMKEKKKNFLPLNNRVGELQYPHFWSRSKLCVKEHLQVKPKKQWSWHTSELLKTCVKLKQTESETVVQIWSEWVIYSSKM